MPYTHELEMLMINKNVSFLSLSEETRQIIKEKLIKMGKKPHNVQTELDTREEDAEFIMQRDVNGVYLEIEPPMKATKK